MPTHTLTVTRTTTSSSSAIILNTGYLKGVHGLLKLFQVIIGIVCVGIVSYYFSHAIYADYQVDLYYLLAAVTCLITTFLLLLSALISVVSSSILPKTTFEYLYHGTAFLLYLVAGIAYLATLVRRNDRRGYKEEGYNEKMAAAALALVNAVLYLLSAIMTYRVYRIG